MADVFISYSHKDRDYAHRLADELRCHQIDVWIDDRIDYGDEWPRTIQQNLIACQTFIVLMSTNAFNSVWVQNEVSYAQANHKTIFPLLLEGEVWLSMSAMQYVDVRAGEMPPSRFFEKVQNSLSPSPSRPRDSPMVQSAEEPVRGTRNHKTGLLVAGFLFVFTAAAVIVYLVSHTVVPTPTEETPNSPPSVQFEDTAIARTQTAAWIGIQNTETALARAYKAHTETERAHTQKAESNQTRVAEKTALASTNIAQTDNAQIQTADWLQTQNAYTAETQTAAWVQTQNAKETSENQTATWLQAQNATDTAQAITATWIEIQNIQMAQTQTATWLQTQTALYLAHLTETAIASHRSITFTGTITITDSETKTYQTFQIDESVRLDPMYREHQISIKNRCFNGASVKMDLKLTLDPNDNTTVYVQSETVLLEGTNCVEKSFEKDREYGSVGVARDTTRDWIFRLEDSDAKFRDTADIHITFRNIQQQ